METAKPQIIKQTENELVMKSASGGTIESYRLPDGSFRIKNEKGEDHIFSQEEIRKIVDASTKPKEIEQIKDHFHRITGSDAKNYFNNSYQFTCLVGGNDKYPTVKELIQQPYTKDAVLRAFRDYVTLIDKKQYDGYESSAENVSKGILEFPKVIVENHYNQDIKYMANELARLGELRLPFPRIVVLSGECVDDNKIVATTSEEQKEVNMIFAFYMTQVQEGIEIDLLLANVLTHKNYLYLHKILLVIKNGELTFVNDTEQPVSVPSEESNDFMRTAIVAIYMTTLNGGDFYMSVPTKEEAAINAKRIRKGKKPLVEFRLVTITGKRNELPSSSHSHHESPRQHWRRGHWRFMKKSGKQVWIAPMLVGDEKNGKIIKDYAVGKYDETTEKRI